MNLNLFPKFVDYSPAIPIWCLTPNRGGCIHRFFDTCPISPSGRYVAVFRLPNEKTPNVPLDEGHVVLIDLLEGTEEEVARTCGWETQMGCNLNWGATDHELIFNDVDPQTWKPLLVKLDPLKRKSERIEGGVYHVSPNGKFAASASLDKMCRTQFGYGVKIPEEQIGRNIGAPADDGLFVTDLETGTRRLLFSLQDALPYLSELDETNVNDWELYGFHSKWSPCGTRIIFTIRRFLKEGPMRFSLITSTDPAQKLRYEVLTMNVDGTNVANAVPAKAWESGGHHINWFPDGNKLSMNLGGFGEGLRFVEARTDGSGLKPIFPTLFGSGHPTIHPSGKFLLTDSYDTERVSFGDGTVPLRWINMETGVEQIVARIGARTEPNLSRLLRVDPHPAWDRTGRYVVFNGVAAGDNTRRVFLADFHQLLDA